MRQRYMRVINQRMFAADNGITRNAKRQRSIIHPIVIHHELMALNTAIVKGKNVGVRLEYAQVL